MRELEHVSGIERIRISSIEPNLLTTEIIKTVSESAKLVPHFHIPLQSGSDTILKKMRRRYLTALYESKIKEIKERMPECCIGADVMVGFPGETEDLFLETYNFLRDLPLSYLHVFTYSERQNTPAALMPGSVMGDIRATRSKMLRILSDKKKRAFYEENINQEFTVLVEQDVANGLIFGFTDNYIRVGIPHNPSLVNQLVEVRLKHLSDANHVTGELLELQPI